MYYNYKCGNGVIKVFVNYDNDKNVDVVGDKNNYTRTVHSDDNGGKFFTWNKNKVYLNDWIRTPMGEFKKRIENKEFITSDELCRAILSAGVENVKFIVPMGKMCIGNIFYDPSKTEDKLCKIEETFNRYVAQNYKIKLITVEPSNNTVGYCEYYTMDMVQEIRNGHIKIA